MSVKERLIYSRLAYWLVHRPVFRLSAKLYSITKKTPWFSYWSMRKLYFFEGNRLRNRDRGVLETTGVVQPNEKSIFQFSDDVVEHAFKELESQGFSILPMQLPVSEIEYLTELSHQLHPIARDKTEQPPAPLPSVPTHARYDYTESSLREDPRVQALVREPLFVQLAEKYLRAKPVNDLIAMWWNFHQDKIETSMLAQEYHSDIDRLRFVKFFFYLTDVTEETGPHCFIRGSHRNAPPELRRDRRHLEKSVFSYYKRSEEMRFTGKRGLILAEDTIGLHKGLPLLTGSRLMFQIEYSSSMFGQSTP